MDRIEAHREWYARLITAMAGILPSDRRILDAFAATPRERFVGPGPWQVFTRIGYVETPADDPTFLYQDVAVALDKERQINNGQPSLHAICLAALAVREGEGVVHVGAGSGYYSAILARLAGPAGSVDAYEVDPELARRAAENLAEVPNMKVHAVSGTEGGLPACDAIYVNAGATGPADAWLDALRPGGRLLFPLTAAQGAGAMLLVTRAGDGASSGGAASGAFAARFVCGASFIPCLGARDEETEKALTTAFQRGGMHEVRSLRRGAAPDATAWCAGRGWWLSTAG
jgi:protein-L-isoaspartate(D-aspartate) O-methyltransferase